MRTCVAALALLFVAASAHAQINQTSVRLNDPTLAGQYLSVASKADLQGTGAFTLEAWVYPTSFTSFPTIIGNDYRTGYWLGLNTAGQVRFYPRALQYVDTPAAVALNTWTHIATTYDPAAGYVIYVNGLIALSGATITGAATPSAGDLRIGADRELGVANYFWRGYLDEVRIWTGVARTPSEIYGARFAGAGRPFINSGLYANLQGNWDMQLPFTTQAYDRASGQGVAYNGADCVGGTMTTMLSANGPPVAYNVGVEFNGTDNYGVLPIGDGYGNGLTIEAWVCPYSYNPGSGTIVGRGFQSSFWLGLNPSGIVRFYPRGGFGQYFEGTAPIGLNTFTHVAATYKDGVSHIYVNGRLQSASAAFTGPVGENGHRPWIGADSTSGGPAYFFPGILDEVRVTQGARSVAQIRQDMYVGYSGGVVTSLTDEAGFSRPSAGASLDGWTSNQVFGTNARIVRSSAPMFSWLLAGPSFENPGDATASVLGGFGLNPPEDINAWSLATDMAVAQTATISDVDLFVSAATTDLSRCMITVRSPALTSIAVLAPGQARGRDLQTVFNDEAAYTLANGDLPYYRGVVPGNPLSAFDGESSNGTWRLTMLGDAFDHSVVVSLNAWGLRINGLTLGVAGPSAASDMRLRNEGPSVVRGQGQLAFSLAQATRLKLQLLDVQGRVARELLDADRDAGEYHVAWNAEGLPSGMYFVRLAPAGGKSQSIRVIVAR